ncbi:hypothetical protein RJ640_016753 [Escallonia rubra]|uniref:Pentatricopeptide repeat-containing protein n=1 Tax=Escallonia rubra TaxID=112253 RepID=A0AA88UGE9_9ASTE|nr:hypothetical protein RJ640_016753 [Escallonia rubra]
MHQQVKDLVLRGLYDQALALYKNQLHLHATSTSILPSVIKACSHAPTHRFLGLQLHCNVLKSGSGLESTISNSIISMYAKFQETQLARQVFNAMLQRDSISWNSMINCYIQNGYYVKSLEMFREMYVCGFVPKPELIASVLSACVQAGNFRLGRAIHALLIVDGRIENSVFLSTALVDMYWRCQDSLVAFRVFDRMEEKNEVSWTAMISGCVAAYDYKIAFDCFLEMQLEGVKPNRVTCIEVLPACAEVGFAKQGKEIHAYAFRHGFYSDMRFSSALIDLYGKQENTVHFAKLIFELATTKDVVMWSSMITNFAQSLDGPKESVRLFGQMQKQGVSPNFVTLLAVISACTNLSSIDHGRGAHGFALKSGMIFELSIGNSIINMYSKCGFLGGSHQTFQEMPVKDSITWSSLIGAYGLHGCAEEALQLFYVMQERGIEADGITYLAVLSACNHSGRVEEGQTIFHVAVENENLSLTMEHYACLIDLLGRAGKLEDASLMVTTMPMKPSMRIWSSLVSACKLHGRLEVAEMLAHRLITLEPENAANHTLLSMVYAESGDWVGVEDVRRKMKVRGFRKSYGFSRIELENAPSQRT